MFFAWLLIGAVALNIVILVLMITFFIILKERLSKLVDLILISHKPINYNGAKRGPKPKQSIEIRD